MHDFDFVSFNLHSNNESCCYLLPSFTLATSRRLVYRSDHTLIIQLGVVGTGHEVTEDYIRVSISLTCAKVTTVKKLEVSRSSNRDDQNTIIKISWPWAWQRIRWASAYITNVTAYGLSTWRYSHWVETQAAPFLKCWCNSVGGSGSEMKWGNETRAWQDTNGCNKYEMTAKIVSDTARYKMGMITMRHWQLKHTTK